MTLEEFIAAHPNLPSQANKAFVHESKFHHILEWAQKNNVSWCSDAAEDLEQDPRAFFSNGHYNAFGVRQDGAYFVLIRLFSQGRTKKEVVKYLIEKNNDGYSLVPWQMIIPAMGRSQPEEMEF
jgi:hypothetical protein